MIDFLQEYISILTLGICLCIGYGIKKIDFIPNKYIPLFTMLIGLIINIWVSNCDLEQFTITPSIVLGGLCSGLASCGMYDILEQWIFRDREVEICKDK